MVIRGSHQRRSGWLTAELAVTIGILAGVLLPVAFSFVLEQRLARAYYFRAMAIGIVDGEIEALAAGEWKSFSSGTNEYPVRLRAVENLPPGKFLVTLSEETVRLEWAPEGKGSGGPVWREVKISREREGGL
jgi:hypothetical protein